MPNKEDEKKLDKELKESFPASDPTTGNNFVGAPTKEEKDKSCCGCGNTHERKE